MPGATSLGSRRDSMWCKQDARALLSRRDEGYYTIYTVRLPEGRPRRSTGFQPVRPGAWGWNEWKVSWSGLRAAREDGAMPPRGSQSVHRSEEAGNDRGAKGRRKVN